MDWLSGITIIIIIIFAVTLLAATGYVLWFAITHGVWGSFEADISAMITQAEKNASALGGIISREFNAIEDKLTGAYQTVSTSLVNAGNIVKAKGDDTINRIKTGGDDAIAKMKNTFNSVGKDLPSVTKTAIDTVESTATDTVGKIQSTTNTAITQIKTAFATVQSTLVDTGSAVSTQSDKIIQGIKDMVTAAYTTISSGATSAYATVETNVNDGITKIKTGTTSTTEQVTVTTTSIVSKIKAGGDAAVTTIINQSETIISDIRAKSLMLGSQIAQDAATVAEATTNAANTIGMTGTTTSRRTTPAAGVAGFQDFREGFQTADIVPIGQSLLFNLQPLSIKDTGFLGPYPRGSYKEDIATANVLKAGCRFLTLQIDYTDVKMDLSLFEVPGVPTLLVRGPDGTLFSKNSGSIKDVAMTIANMGFNAIVPHNQLPIILYLHIVRAPNALNDPDGYLSFLSQIADALNPIAPFHLGLNPQGNFTRQKMAAELLTVPMNSLEGQIIVMSNADTSLFRRSTITKNKYPPAKDLDFWVNIRVYLETPEDLNGITQLADPANPPAAVLVDLKRILSLSSMNMDAFAAKGKLRYVIAMGPRTTNPSSADLDIALNRLGVNVVPIDIFTDSDRNILLLSNEYGNKSFHQKPVNLQSSV